MQRLVVVIAALIALAGAAAISLRERGPARQISAAGAACPAGSSAMVRNELYFGLSRKDAAPVGEAEWAAFVDTEVTPRFPDGLTVVDAYGQWRNASGAIAKERSKILIILRPPPTDGDARLDAIRAAYKSRFAQESVMRVDATACVGF